MQTPQHHLSCALTLTLIIKNLNLLYCMASTSSYCPPPCPPPLVALCLLTLPLAHPCSRGLYPPAWPPATNHTFITFSAPPSISPVWEHVIAVLMKLPPTTAEGQHMRSWVTYHFLTSLEVFLMWELDTMNHSRDLS